MKLKLIDRIMLANILPTEGNIKTLVCAKDIRKKVDFTQDEVKKYEIDSAENGGIKWNLEGAATEFDIEFTELETMEIVKTLKKLDKENKLSIQLMPLVDLFSVTGE